MLGKLLDIRRYAAALLTLVAALVAQAALNVKWWSPVCDMAADGGGFYATGVPFPAARPTVMSLRRGALKSIAAGMKSKTGLRSPCPPPRCSQTIAMP